MNPASISVSDDIITIVTTEGNLVIAPTGGSDDPLSFSSKSALDFELSADSVDELQRALLNFSNTGHFDQEG